MFTTVDKALVALIMSVIFLVNNFTSFSIGLEVATVNTAVAFLAPILAYFVPNKAPVPPA